MPFLVPLLAAALVSVSEVCADPTPEGLGSRDLPCPEAEDILPCECTVHGSYTMNMYCSDVDNDELARVFSAHFPFTQHWRLDVRFSDRLDVLRKGDLGVVSIDDFNILFSGLTEVQEEALSQSYSTVERIGLSYNQISKFPFHELPLFTSLRQLYLYDNQLDQFPELNSDSLTLVSLSFNLMSDVPVDGFKGVPNLEVFAFEGNNLQQITPGTFAGLPHLERVYIPRNKLSRIQEGALAVASDFFRELVLSGNDISIIEPNAITGD
ncbi:oplophorus-luciferin 2-monooxygenase non-catalytic subunit-like [Penaeus indicus]|uniref:oplophorus-luciferin 2-monooxygenase non-catalytic subunit-like n=1 Tax=Penaeus indicus TaxID=29960 RepID=UPI00300CFAE8